MKLIRFENSLRGLTLLLLALWTTLVSGEDDLDRKVAPSDTIFIEVFGEKDLTVDRRVQA